MLGFKIVMDKGILGTFKCLLLPQNDGVGKVGRVTVTVN